MSYLPRKEFIFHIIYAVLGCDTLNIILIQTYTGNSNKMAGSGIQKEVLSLPHCWQEKLAFVLHNVFTEKYCCYNIFVTFKEVFLIKQVSRPDIRNSSRCIWDSEEEATKIWKRIKKYVPDVWSNRDVMGLNERLRVLRYDPGEYFLPHLDGSYIRDNGETSYITIQIYLNQGFEGGSTTFMSFDEKEKVEVVPKTGSVLIFQHDILHEGSLLIKGRKYAIRTDVMYSSETRDKKKKKGIISSLFNRGDS
ncbi:hypothetical protein KUTeg_022767 [Tegillarca granosa]|uniref:Prolyl 4-hydroxylase alpha subunit domain-containing protein n=1 Tax=Tegillarca granosa TaxID=220873 RepID=A0ABQ9E591_TEGGR|nr:hypothetical protein KUTeg_022767 [Tegillarca granosa]